MDRLESVIIAMAERAVSRWHADEFGAKRTEVQGRISRSFSRGVIQFRNVRRLSGIGLCGA